MVIWTMLFDSSKIFPKIFEETKHLEILGRTNVISSYIFVLSYLKSSHIVPITLMMAKADTRELIFRSYFRFISRHCSCWFHQIVALIKTLDETKVHNLNGHQEMTITKSNENNKTDFFFS